MANEERVTMRVQFQVKMLINLEVWLQFDGQIATERAFYRAVLSVSNPSPA